MQKVRFPFRLVPGQEINNLGSPYVCEGSIHSLRLGEQSGWYFISAEGMQSEDEGKEFLVKLWAGMMWALLQRGMAAQMSMLPQVIGFYPDSTQAAKNVSLSTGLQIDRLDAIIDGALPAIYGTEKSIKIMTGQNVSLRLGHAPAQTMSCIVEALSMPHPERVAENRKLQIALDLYNAFFWESSANARFINLNMALEALAPIKDKDQCAVVLIERWMEETKQLLSSSTDEVKKHAYESLIREIGFRRQQSIRSSIRELVYSSLVESDERAEHLSKRAVSLYDIRGQLVHAGYVENVNIGSAADELREIVSHVLKVNFLRNANT